jgi:proline dehydrogenase
MMRTKQAAGSSAIQRIPSRTATALDAAFRGGILISANNAFVTRLVQRYGRRLGASRFVAGETLDQCMPVFRRLNAQGLRVNTSILGEDVRDESTASAITDAYVDVIDRLVIEGVDGNVAVKLTHLGLNLGETVAYQNVARLAAHAGILNTFLRIDMEESARVDATLRIYRQLREAGHDNVGTVLQASLYRTEDDLTDLLPLRPNLRLVKGAYLEPDTVAYPKKTDVDANYRRLAERMLAGEGFAAIATHDERLIAHVIDVAQRGSVPRDRFEFQMLYGIRPQLQLDLVAQGYRVLVATPYGPDWYPYLMRRLAERPANLLFFARNILRR